MKRYAIATKKKDILLATISVVGIMLIITLIDTLSIYPSLVMSQKSAENISQMMKNIDPGHKFSILFKSHLRQSNPPQWDMAIYVNATPSVLKNIKKVNYLAYPGFGCPTCVANETVTDPKYNFAVGAKVYAGPRVNATIYFKDNQIIKYPSLQTSTPCSAQVCPVELNIIPKMTGLMAKINGEATAKHGNIKKITVDWGDKNQTIQNSFPFTHKYSKAGAYTITISAQSSTDVLVSQNVQTTALILENSIPPDSSIKINARSNSILNASTSSTSIQDETPVFFIVSGKLSALNTTSGIGKQQIAISMFPMNHPDRLNSRFTVYTNSDGSYDYKYNNLILPSGVYKIIVTPVGDKYAGLNVTKDLLVLPHPFTMDQYITYSFAAIAAGATIIGAILKLPGYFSRKQQGKNLKECLTEVNGEHNKYKNKQNPLQADKNQYLMDLEELRIKFMDFVADKKITEDQYKMLSDVVSSRAKEV